MDSCFAAWVDDFALLPWVLLSRALWLREYHRVVSSLSCSLLSLLCLFELVSRSWNSGNFTWWVAGASPLWDSDIRFSQSTMSGPYLVLTVNYWSSLTAECLQISFGLLSDFLDVTFSGKKLKTFVFSYILAGLVDPISIFNCSNGFRLL